MDEREIADIWMMFKEYLDKKQVETAAERFVDLLADYGVSDETFSNALGADAALDYAITYYLDIDNTQDEDEYDWDE
jgi:hypothetical protein